MASTDGWKAPKTEMPAGLIFWLFCIVVALVLVSFLVTGQHWFFGLVIVSLVLGFSTKSYTQGVPQYYAVIMMDNFLGGGKQRVIFQGVHLKLPWESPQLDEYGRIDFINLRTETKGVIENETYPTQDGLVVGTYVFTMKINTKENAAENVILWASYDSPAVFTVLRALVSRTFSSYCQKRLTEDLIDMDNEVINDNAFPAGKLCKFEGKYGVETVTILEDLDRDPKLQKAKDTIAEAKSYGEAHKALRDEGMNDETATQFLKLMKFPNVSEQTYKVDVTGLDLSKLEHFNFLGVPKPIGTTGGGKK